MICVYSFISHSGISGKSQILFAIVFTTRYLDLLTNFVSLYNTAMKVFFIAGAFGTIYLMLVKFKATYNSNHDTFRIGKWIMNRSSRLVCPTIYVRFRPNCRFDSPFSLLTRAEFLLIPAALISLVINHSFDPMEILWTFSIYLECVAILPQLFMISKTGEAESITSHYLFALGAYRALYIFNWAYRYSTLKTVKLPDKG